MKINYLSSCVLMTLALMISGNAISADPAHGHFDFINKTKREDHYFSIRAQPIFGQSFFGGWIVGTGMMRVNTYNKQTFGLNVYWKTRGHDQNRGRNVVSAYHSRLPRCSFSAEKQCGRGNSLNGSSEHVEGLIFSESGVANNSLIDGFPPDKAHRKTRFFDHRYNFNYSPITGRPESAGEDENVQLGVTYFAQAADACLTEFCNGTMDNPTPGYIYIPTNRLEYLIIEVIGVQYANLVLDKNDGFYPHSVFAIKYVPTGNGKQMRVFHTDKRYPGVSRFTPGSTSDTAIFKEFGNTSDGHGFFDSGDSNIHAGAEIVDFKNIDSINVTLKYNNAFPDFNTPQQTGIAVDFDIKNLRCSILDKSCGYPGY